MLLTEELADYECLSMKGAERFSDYTGYASSFAFHRDHIDALTRLVSHHRYSN